MRKLNCMCELNRNIYVWIKSQIVNTKQNQIGFHMVPNDDPYGSSAVSVTDDHLFHLLILLHVHNPLMPVGNYSYQFFICCLSDSKCWKHRSALMG